MLFSPWVLSDSLQPHGLQYARLPCPSLSSGGWSNSCPFSWWWKRIDTRICVTELLCLTPEINALLKNCTPILNKIFKKSFGNHLFLRNSLQLHKQNLSFIFAFFVFCYFYRLILRVLNLTHESGLRSGKNNFLTYFFLQFTKSIWNKKLLVTYHLITYISRHN